MSFRSTLGQLLTPVLAVAFCLSISTPASAKESAAAALPTITLKAGGQSVRAEVAASEERREKGLMFREKMGKNEGMLFIFPQPGYHAMWMQYTPLPLAVAFMDERGRIVSIHEMKPFTETTHQAAGPARYALEMNGGWFSANKVKVGDAITGLDKAPKPQ